MLVLQKIRVSIKFFQENKARELNKQVNTDRSFSLGYPWHSDVMRYHKFTDRWRAPSCWDRIRSWRLQDFQCHNAECVLKHPWALDLTDTSCTSSCTILSLTCYIFMWLVASLRSLLSNPFFKLRKMFWESECACLLQPIKIITLSCLMTYTEHLSN